jgi:hypothetical protein
MLYLLHNFFVLWLEVFSKTCNACIEIKDIGIESGPNLVTIYRYPYWNQDICPVKQQKVGSLSSEDGKRISPSSHSKHEGKEVCVN